MLLAKEIGFLEPSISGELGYSARPLGYILATPGDRLPLPSVSSDCPLGEARGNSEVDIITMVMLTATVDAEYTTLVDLAAVVMLYAASPSPPTFRWLLQRPPYTAVRAPQVPAVACSFLVW
jgi:hypothetical protein